MFKVVVKRAREMRSRPLTPSMKRSTASVFFITSSRPASDLAMPFTRRCSSSVGGLIAS
jgi:hypothetical protein